MIALAWFAYVYCYKGPLNRVRPHQPLRDELIRLQLVRRTIEH